MRTQVCAAAECRPSSSKVPKRSTLHFLSENEKEDAIDRQDSSHLAISMVGGTENTLEPLYFMREMLEDMKTVSAFADAQNHVFHIRNAA